MSGEANQPVNLWTMPTLELECSPGGFRAESKTVLGKVQSPRVKASQGFYCSGFIRPNNQTNKFPVHMGVCDSISTGESVSGVLLFGFYSTKQTKKIDEISKVALEISFSLV